MNVYLFIESLNHSEKKALEEYFSKHKTAVQAAKISVDNFISSNRLSVRLRNILQSTDGTGKPHFFFTDEIQKRDFMRLRNAGEKSWSEFVDVLSKIKTV